MTPSAHWWSDDSALRRFICDLLAAELARSRLDRRLPNSPWPLDLPLGSGGLDVDSLELLSLAAALTQALHLHRSGIEDYLLARRRLGDWIQIAAAGLARYSDTLTFLSSGSGGAPKACDHRLALLQQEVAALVPLLERPGRVIAAVPCHHIYGFIFTILLPRFLDLPVVDLSHQSALSLSSQLRSGDLVIGHPEFWRAAARATPAFPPDVTGVCSTAPLSDEIALQLEAHGLQRLIEIYGASETAGVGWRDCHDAPYQLHDFWQKGDSPHYLSRQLPDGGSLTVLLQDDILWLPDRQFRPQGRRDGMVQVGGINVDPAKVAELLLQHDSVAAAAVRLMRPEEGSRLKAFVVAKYTTDPDLLRQDLFAWTEQRLSAAERPKAIRFGPALPVGLLGKAIDWPA